MCPNDDNWNLCTTAHCVFDELNTTLDFYVSNVHIVHDTPVNNVRRAHFSVRI